MKCLYFSENLFKKPQNRSECLTLLEKPHITIKKASISLKMPSKRIEIFTKTSISLEIIIKASSFLKKPQITLKKPENISKIPRNL
jgi:hypothetical protein